MNYYSPFEISQNYAQAGRVKTGYSTVTMIWMALIGGMLIALGGSAAAAASHALTNAGLAKLVSGMLFPFGLGMIIILGVELFTGNIMLIMSVLERHITPYKMLRNWILVYLGNFAGGVILAYSLAHFGGYELSGGQLAVTTVATAAYKSSLPWVNGLVLGIFANVLVCIGVLVSLSGKDTISRIAGAFIPVSLFVILGFEHSIANMYYIPAGLFSLQVPKYAQLVAQAGIDISGLSWGNFLWQNLVPVTIGNILGGLFVGVSMWYFQLRPQRTKVS